LALFGETGDVATHDLAHLCEETTGDGGVEGLVEGIDVLEMEEVAFASVFSGRTDSGHLCGECLALDDRVVGETGGGYKLVWLKGAKCRVCGGDKG